MTIAITCGIPATITVQFAGTGGVVAHDFDGATAVLAVKTAADAATSDPTDAKAKAKARATVTAGQVVFALSDADTLAVPPGDYVAGVRVLSSPQVVLDLGRGGHVRASLPVVQENS